MPAIDARRHVWEGQIPLSLQLHHEEVTAMPAPPPLLVMASRNSYLPLLADVVKQHFQSVLLPGDETLWFDFKGLPLKWHIPTGVLFDLLCIEPERPWNLSVHFRAFPTGVLNPYEGIDAAKWNFMNSLKEATYVMHGNTKSVMNLTQIDQKDLWKSVTKGDMDEYDRIAVKFSARPGESTADTGRLPIRLYVRMLRGMSVDDSFDVPPVEDWDDVITMTRPLDLPLLEEGQVFTLGDALVRIVPQFFQSTNSENAESSAGVSEYKAGSVEFRGLVRIQGIEPSLDLPLHWIAKNLASQESFTHVCIWAFEM